MRDRSAAILLVLLALAAYSCSRAPQRALDFPLVQKYTTHAGDLFYFRPRDGQFVLLERRKALAVAVAPEPNIQAYSYEDRITVSRPQDEMLENTVFLRKSVLSKHWPSRLTDGSWQAAMQPARSPFGRSPQGI